MKTPIIISNLNFSQNVTFLDKTFHLQLLTENTAEKNLTFSKGSLYLYVQTGIAFIENNNISFEMKEGMYASLSGETHLKIETKSTIVAIFIDNFKVLNTIGGPTEATGRLKYIDGCSDTLLLSPSRLGEPCLNLLHFPAQTKQSSHHHPSFRFGIVANGQGECIQPESKKDLCAGDIFFIPPFVEHKFDTTNTSMNIIAFHPDSDWGPTDEVHPMINKTLF